MKLRTFMQLMWISILFFNRAAIAQEIHNTKPINRKHSTLGNRWHAFYLHDESVPEQGSCSFRTASASSSRGENLPQMAIDEDLLSRWESEFSDPQWWMLSFDQACEFDRIVIDWEHAYAKDYSLLISMDGETWAEILRYHKQNLGIDDHTLPRVRAKYVKIVGHARATQYGYSIKDVNIPRRQPLIHSLPLESLKKQGRVIWTPESIHIEAKAPSQRVGAWSSPSLSGHFQIESFCDPLQAKMLALFHMKEGRPDPDNYVALVIDPEPQGAKIHIEDRQGALARVLDGQRSANPKRYQQNLDGGTYSLPFTETDGTMRVFHDRKAGVIRFSYGVKKRIDGHWARGWVDLPVIPVWGERDQSYVPAILTSDTLDCRSLLIEQLPLEDQDDRSQGFRAERRPYFWSGLPSEALVITFGEEFPYASSGKKFVFAKGLNYIPAWHFNDQLLFVYEFVETWGGGLPGCLEPMSDRLLLYSNVTLEEDHDVRKVVHWTYALHNPNYQHPSPGQAPEVHEWYTFYPDGTVLRRIRYIPNLTAPLRNWHELSELIVVGGTLSRPGSLLARPALTLTNLKAEQRSFHPGPPLRVQDFVAWPQIIQVAHFKEEPDAFQAWSQEPSFPETYAHYPLVLDLTWHNTSLEMSHWPYSNEPYTMDHDKTLKSKQGEVAHTSLIGVGIHEGVDWKQHVQYLPDGRPYREWVTLLGLERPQSLTSIQDRVRMWLLPPVIKLVKGACRFLGHDVRTKVWRIEGAGCQLSLALSPGMKSLSYPILSFETVGQKPPRILWNHRDVKTKIAYGTDSRLLMWLDLEVTEPGILTLEDTEASHVTQR